MNRQMKIRIFNKRINNMSKTLCAMYNGSKLLIVDVKHK